MRHSCSIFIVLALLSTSIAEKKVVTYLGTDFILPGGCPPLSLAQCNPEQRNCLQEHNEMQEKFDECMVEKAKKQGCLTDRIPGGKLITIPQLANFCTKHCSLDNRLASIHECPYEGLIHTSIDPELERQFHE